MRWRLGLVLAVTALLFAAIVVAGCGGDDGSNSDSPSPESPAPSQANEVPTDADELKDSCVDELTRMGQSEEQAKKACTVPDDADIDKAVEAAVEGCLDVAKQLPAGSERDQAEQDCRDSGK